MKPVSIDEKSIRVLAQGVLPAGGAPYVIALLNEDHIDQIMCLQDRVTAALTAGEKSFFLKKPRSFFAAHFKASHDNVVLGIITGGHLVAQSIVRCPTAEYPDTGMVDMPPVGAPETVTVFQGVAVLPSYRGNDLMQKMARVWLDMAAQKGKQHALAEIEIRNVASWHSLLKEGLSITGMGVDPDDGALVYNAHGRFDASKRCQMTPEFNRNSAKLCAHDDIAEQKNLFRAGYRCVAYDKTAGQMIFKAI